MRRALCFLSAALLALLVVPPSATAASPSYFYETRISEDVLDDVPTAGLDIVGVHVYERYKATNSSAGHTLVFRLDLADGHSLNEAPASLPAGKQTFSFRFTVGFKVGDQAETISGLVQVVCDVDTTRGPYCGAPAGDGNAVMDSEGDVLLFKPLMGTALGVGSLVKEIWASTARLNHGQFVCEDMVPGDSKGAPVGDCAAPASTLQYALVGPYPFLQLVSADPQSAYTVAAGETEVLITFQVVAVSAPDNIQLTYHLPDGWSAENSLQDEFNIGTRPNVTIETLLKIKAADIVPVGTVATVHVVAHLVKSGGLVSFPVTLTVCETRCNVPQIDFQLVTPGPFKQGETSTIRLKVLRNNLSLDRYPVVFDLVGPGGKIGPYSTTFVANGTYETTVVFPDAGTYTLDAYLDEKSPKPHETFSITVEKKAGMLPGAEVGLVLASLAAALLLRRRA